MHNLVFRTFLCCTFITFLFLLFISLRDYKRKKLYVITVNEKYVNKDVNIGVQTSYVKQVSRQLVIKNVTTEKNNPKLKYILQWTAAANVPFVYMGVGREGFTSRHCPYTNCFVTDNKDLLDDITKFDVIAFAGPEVVYMLDYKLPMIRSPHQKYAFASIESSENYPVCSNRFDGYFNWTWTYRLDSDVRWGYMVIKDANNNTVGPNKIMHWIKKEDMAPVSAEFKEKISSKNRAAAWFVSNCIDSSGRMIFAQELRLELKKYNHALDIYGQCGPYSCPRENSAECNELLQDHYYFYLSFENSFSEDYATEKLRTALMNNVVPIVYGGANYSRFMPDGIYLNARELGVQKLAERMDQLIKDKEEYANFFRWKKYYSYHRRAEFPETDEYCMFCTLLNDEEKLKRTEIVENFRDWWDNPKTC